MCFTSSSHFSLPSLSLIPARTVIITLVHSIHDSSEEAIKKMIEYSIVLSIPLALFAGAFVVVAPEAYRKMRDT
jgi:hypothetical protein